MDKERNRGFPHEIRPGSCQIGWIGAGIMGGAMASRLLAAGFPLAVYARTPSKAARLTAAGAILVDSPAAAAANADVIFTMVGHPSDVRTVVLDPESGALASAHPNAVFVDCTSSDPDLAFEIAAAASARGCFAVDAPVSGGDAGAEEGRLAIFAGGDESVVSWLEPLFCHLGRPTWMGPPGSGQSSKIANQIAMAGVMVGLSESITFASKSGLHAGTVMNAIKGGAAWSRAMDLFGEKVLERDFRPGGSVEYMVKDLGMALDHGGGGDVLPGTAVFREMFERMIANGDRKMGIHGLITVIERTAGVSDDRRPN